MDCEDVFSVRDKTTLKYSYDIGLSLDAQTTALDTLCVRLLTKANSPLLGCLGQY